MEDTKALVVQTAEGQATVSASKTVRTSKDKLATKSVVEQGVTLKTEATDKLVQLQEASMETGLLTEAKEEKRVAAKKPKKSGVSALICYIPIELKFLFFENQLSICLIMILRYYCLKSTMNNALTLNIS